MILKSCVIILLIILIYLISKKKVKENFQTPTRDTSGIDLSIELIPNTPNPGGTAPDGYRVINSTNRGVPVLDIDTNYENDNMNVNIGNSIISENNIQINGKDINIKDLRYIKKLPYHYTKEICLSDANGDKECVNKEHIDIVKGVRPIQFISYPDNYRQCLQAFEKNFLYNIHGTVIDNAKVFTSQNCEDGLTHQHFKIKRDHNHTDRESHYHIHGSDKDMHSHRDTSARNINYIDASMFSSFENDLEIGISEAVLPLSEGGLGLDLAQAELLDTEEPYGKLSAAELGPYLGVSVGSTYGIPIHTATLPVVDGGLGLTLEQAEALDTNNDRSLSREEMLYQDEPE